MDPKGQVVDCKFSKSSRYLIRNQRPYPLASTEPKPCIIWSLGANISKYESLEPSGCGFGTQFLNDDISGASVVSVFEHRATACQLTVARHLGHADDLHAEVPTYSRLEVAPLDLQRAERCRK